MSKLAYHADHFKAGAVSALAKHNWEKRTDKDSHSNQDIDPARSHLNVQLIEQEKSLYRAVKDDIETRCTGRVTAASNWVSETITYCPDDIKDDRERCIKFFKDVLAWHQEEFGTNNVKASTIHFDETTPHLHTDLIPLTDDGRLSAKSVFARANLLRHHDDLAAYLKERGWNIERGESTKGKHVRAKSVPEYKKQAEAEKLRAIKARDEALQKASEATERAEKAEARIKELEAKLERTKATVVDLRDMDELADRARKTITGKVVRSKKDDRILREAAAHGATYDHHLRKAEEALDEERERSDVAKDALEKMANELNKAKAKITELERALNSAEWKLSAWQRELKLKKEHEAMIEEIRKKIEKEDRERAKAERKEERRERQNIEFNAPNMVR